MSRLLYQLRKGFSQLGLESWSFIILAIALQSAQLFLKLPISEQIRSILTLVAISLILITIPLQEIRQEARLQQKIHEWQQKYLIEAQQRIKYRLSWLIYGVRDIIYEDYLRTSSEVVASTSAKPLRTAIFYLDPTEKQLCFYVGAGDFRPEEKDFCFGRGDGGHSKPEGVVGLVWASYTTNTHDLKVKPARFDLTQVSVESLKDVFHLTALQIEVTRDLKVIIGIPLVLSKTRQFLGVLIIDSPVTTLQSLENNPSFQTRIGTYASTIANDLDEELMLRRSLAKTE